MVTPYSRLKDIDEKSTVVVLRITFAFLSAATLFSGIAALRYVKAGTPEYAVFARPFGGDAKDWKSVGSIACPRTERPDDVIFKKCVFCPRPF